MSRINQLQSKLVIIEKAVESLNTLSERIWKIENPPKYKYGDVIELQETTGTSLIKVLESNMKYQGPLSWADGAVVRAGFFFWEYQVDIIGTGLRILTEEQILLLIKNTIQSHD